MKKMKFLKKNLGREFTYFRACCGECWYFDPDQNWCEHLDAFKSPTSSPCGAYC